MVTTRPSCSATRAGAVPPRADREAIVRGYAQKAGFAKEQVKAA